MRLLSLFCTLLAAASTVLLVACAATTEWFDIQGQNTSSGDSFHTSYSIIGRIVQLATTGGVSTSITLDIWSKACSGLASCTVKNCDDLKKDSSDYGQWLWLSICPIGQVTLALVAGAVLCGGIGTIMCLLSAFNRVRPIFGSGSLCICALLTMASIVVWGAAVPGRSDPNFFATMLNGGSITFGPGVSYYLPVVATFLLVCAIVLSCCDTFTLGWKSGNVEAAAAAAAMVSNINSNNNIKEEPPTIIGNGLDNISVATDPRMAKDSYYHAPRLDSYHPQSGSVNMINQYNNNNDNYSTYSVSENHPPSIDPRFSTPRPDHMRNLHPLKSREFLGPHGNFVQYVSPPRQNRRATNNPDHYFRREPGNSIEISALPITPKQASLQSQHVAADKWQKMFPTSVKR